MTNNQDLEKLQQEKIFELASKKLKKEEMDKAIKTLSTIEYILLEPVNSGVWFNGAQTSSQAMHRNVDVVNLIRYIKTTLIDGLKRADNPLTSG